MNNTDYLEKLLWLCTDDQKNLFDRMYPNWPSSKQMKRAIVQVESTLKNLNQTKEDLNYVKRQADDEITIKINEIAVLNSEKVKLQNELSEANALAERLSNPIDVSNNYVQEKLNLLEALEAGGVDNWDGYDFAVSGYE